MEPFIVLTGTPEECTTEFNRLKKLGYYTNGSEWINEHEIRMCLFLEERGEQRYTKEDTRGVGRSS